MAKAYWVQTYLSPAKDADAWEAYRRLAGPALTAAGGRYLVRSKPAKTYEAGINELVILIEFDSLEKAIAARNTRAYQEALKVLGTGNVERDIRLVEGE